MALSPAKRAEARAAMLSQVALPRYLTVYELAALIGVHEITVYKRLRSTPELLPRVTRFGGRILFESRDVAEWCDARRGAIVVAPLPAPAAVGETPKRRRGRPTKAEQALRRNAAQSGAVAHQ